ncbi:MAG: glycoside hydrolase family 28 protein [Lachnospiraceae bacterium]|nr:glycoside hydrolase family 28 protein [Lachnospiraceae bacterium]
MISVMECGARGDGISVDTIAIQAALNMCRDNGGGKVVFPGGHIFKTGSLILYSNTELHIESGAVVRGSDDLADYRKFSDVPTDMRVPSYVNCEYDGKPANVFIYAANGENIRITGHGTIDGMEELYYGATDRYYIDGAWYPRTPLIFVENVKHLTVRDVTLTRSGFWTLHMVGCDDVLVDGIRILNNMRMANNDGIDPDHCRNVRIANCHIETADDNIVIKTSKAYENYGPSENIVITGCTLMSTGGAVKFGTESESDFRNVIVENCCIRGTNRGVTLQLRDKGNIENVLVQNLNIGTRRFAESYWGRGEPVAVTCIPRHEGAPLGMIRNVRFRNLNCEGENGIFLYGSEGDPIRDLSFADVHLRLTKTSSWEPDGYDLRPCDGDGKLASKIYGVYAEHTQGLTLESVTVDVDESIRPWFAGERHGC